jgi:hypothetical protein
MNIPEALLRRRNMYLEELYSEGSICIYENDNACNISSERRDSNFS